MEIITDIKVLRRISKRVSPWAGIKTGNKLIKFIKDKNLQCAGLSAPQIGILHRVFVLKNGDDIEIFINPKVVSKGPTIIKDEEGCLSIPGKKFLVSRPSSVEVVDDLRKKPIEIEGMTARAYLHELDHLNGILICDKGEEIQENKKTEDGIQKKMA